MRQAELRLELGVGGELHERDRAVIVEATEAVPAAGHAVHPEQRDEFGTQHVAEELDLGSDVLGADRQVVDPVDPHRGLGVQVLAHRSGSLVPSFGPAIGPRPASQPVQADVESRQWADSRSASVITDMYGLIGGTPGNSEASPM